MALADAYDCVVVGSGHAGSCAALAAVQNGLGPTKVVVVEKSPEEWKGGNGWFTAGAHRTVHGGLPDLLPLVSNVTLEQTSKIDLAPYTAQDFLSDVNRLCSNQSSPALASELVNNSRDTIEWLAKDVGVRFRLAFERQAYEVDGQQKFWGGLVINVVDGGKGLIEDDHAALKRSGVRIEYDTPVKRVLTDGVGNVNGIVVLRDGKEVVVGAKAVVLACGGFEASKELRYKHLGQAWQNARVRGTPYNTGDGLSLASDVGALLTGDWSSGGCHSTCWDANANPDAGDRILSNQYTKSGYPLGLMLNTQGRRFVDEGADFRNYTYAKFGRAILEQPGGEAFQVYDEKAIAWLRKEEYAEDVVERISANTLQELAKLLTKHGLKDPDAFVETIGAYNRAVYVSQKTAGKEWDPSIKDGMSTGGDPTIMPPKSNWALPIDSAPFVAVRVACGITFTFAGVAIDPVSSSVLSEKSGRPIKGLFGAGEIVGGLFFGNYPGGSGLTSGAVFGRKAGRSAAMLVQEEKK